MKKITLFVVIALLLTFGCFKTIDSVSAPEPTNQFTFHFKYGDPLRILEDTTFAAKYRDAAKSYCFTDFDHSMFIYTPLHIDTTYFDPLTLKDQLLRWDIVPYQGNIPQMAGTKCIKAWFTNLITRSNFDFKFRLRFK